MASSEWRMGNAERTIRHSLLERPPGRNPRAPATPSADRPRCPIAPCRASKGLKMLKTTRASYWLELASIWDRRHVRLGSAPRRLGAATLAMTGNVRGNGNSRSPSPSPSRVISFWASPNGTCRLSREARPPALAVSEVVFDARCLPGQAEGCRRARQTRLPALQRWRRPFRWSKRGGSLRSRCPASEGRSRGRGR